MNTVNALFSIDKLDARDSDLFSNPEYISDNHINYPQYKNAVSDNTIVLDTTANTFITVLKW